SLTTVLPAVVHWPVDGLNRSEFVPFAQSTVRTEASGKMARPSSEKVSAFPVPVKVQVKVVALKRADALDEFWPNRNLPSFRTMHGESPIDDHPVGGLTTVHTLVTGL